MNLYFRFLCLYIKLIFKKKDLDPFEEGVLQTFHVSPFDIDMLMHMNNGKYLSILDLGRVELMYRSGILDIAKKVQGLPVVGEINIKYKRQFFLFQKFQVKTRFLHWDDKWVYFEQSFIRKDTVRAVAIVKGCIVGKESGKRMPIEDLLKLTKFDYQSKKKENEND